MLSSINKLEDISSKEKKSLQKKVKPCASDADHKIGLRILIAREQIGLTRSEIAKTIGITQQQIEKYEKGKNRISARTLFIISNLFQKPMSWFTQDIENNNYKNLLVKHHKNKLALNTIKAIKGIKDKKIQNKIIKIVKILTEEQEQ